MFLNLSQRHFFPSSTNRTFYSFVYDALSVIIIFSIIIIISILLSFSNRCQLVTAHWSLRYSKSPRVSRTLLIVAYLTNTVIWMVSILPFPPVSFPSPWRFFYAPIVFGFIVTFMFHSFFSSQAISKYLSFRFLLFSLWSAGTAKSSR